MFSSGRYSVYGDLHISKQPTQYGYQMKGRRKLFYLIKYHQSGASNQDLMMKLEDDLRNSVIKCHNPIKFELV